jgi:acetyl esterase/lipase
VVGFPPLQDAQRAIRYTRAHAEEWNIAPDKIGILGFSAGGNLTALASTQYAVDSYELKDETDKLSARPDFSVLIYPAYCFDEKTGGLMENVSVNAETPPAFLAHAQNDHVTPMSSMVYFAALTKEKIPAGLHIYPKGGHGYGMWDKGHNVNSWPDRCADWLREMEYISTDGEK